MGWVFWMGGVWAVPVFAFLGLSCVFSMKISNYFQHYGLRRVRLPNGPLGERVMPRHSWSADWKFSNWMFFNMQTPCGSSCDGEAATIRCSRFVIPPSPRNCREPTPT